MTDREMLELAAKAAGLTCIWSPDRPDYESNQGQQPIYWNPLEDDGDAFRLAVKLKLDIEFDAESQYPNHVLVEQYDLGLGFREDLLDDPYSATRLAIVKAASEIGRNT